MDKNKLKFWIDLGMGISFLLVALTGILKWPGLAMTTFSWTQNFINFRLMSRIHDWSGLLMAIFVLVHLCLNWAWIKAMFGCMFFKNSFRN
jgi:hypothetical protein